jgi:hypothetical protein
LGRPSTGTPLLAWISNTTDQERKKQAQQAIVEESLFNGVSSEQSEEVRKLVEDNALNDKTRILDLDPKSFVNLALAGGFSKALLADPEVQAKLKEDLATLFAENADGILSEDPRYFRLLTEALQSGDPSNLPEVLREQFDDYKKDYNIIYEDAQTSKAVEDINKFLAEKSDDEIKEAFGLQRPGQVRIIKNRYPYSSKQHFLNELRELESDGFSSSGAWSKFVETQAPPPEGG